MRHQGFAARRLTARHLAAMPLAALLFVGAAVVPPAARPTAPFLAAFDAPVARAADGLAVTTDARYVVVPDEAVVRATVEVTVRNETPNSTSNGVITRYYYDVVNLGVQPEAVRLRATRDGVAVPVDASRKKGYRLVTIGLRGNLYFGQSATVVLSFDLPSGKPRSASDVRVGAAFATFPAWAFGDAATVRVEVPRSFEVSVTGSEMGQASVDGRTVLTATTDDPLAWYAWVNARNDAALTREALDIAGGEEIVVRGWPEDAKWRKRVGNLLAEGVPQLVGLVGLPWPVDGSLTVIEIHSPLLEGYAGLFDVDRNEITVTEDLDDLTIVHEASHAWFNRDLFLERWITEGLADEYAARVLGALGEKRPGPGDVDRTSKVAFPLGDWPPPAAIRDEASAAREQYGYDAAWLVIRRVIRATGEDGMRVVFRAASERTTAYVGEGPAEPTALPNDWRRFVDLTEEVGGATDVDDLVERWVLGDEDAAILGERDDARDAYHDLLVDGDGWAAPTVVRLALDRWSFSDAEARIGEARTVLAHRDETAELAAAIGLTPADDLEAAYEGATDEPALEAAGTLAIEARDALETIATAGEAVAAPRDWLVAFGLEGEDPDADLAAARESWEAGDLDAAGQHAASASLAIAAAPEAGRRRALMLGMGAALVVLALAVVLLLVRRRSRRVRTAAVAIVPMPPSPPAPAPPAPGPPAPSDRWVTLPAGEATGAEPATASTEEQGGEPT